LRDKSPFELEAGLTFDVPLQRRNARGKLMEAQAKLAQLGAKLRLSEQSIAAEVQAADAALQANVTAITQARRNVELAHQLANAERTKLDPGDSDVLTVNLREIATVDAELLLVEAEANYFKAQAQLHAATAPELTPRVPLSVEAQP
jgi:outer membrane protein TolC